ncbi:hypothetical protein [Mycobacterium lepromatosis]|nr:hypothetical protein [Mycobacterium lepromatosis]
MVFYCDVEHVDFEVMGVPGLWPEDAHANELAIVLGKVTLTT